MNIQETIKQRLFECGLFPEQAEEIFQAVKNSDENQSMATRWNDKPADYPPIVFNLVWHFTKQHALEWIDDNCPEAWNRSLFE